MEAEESFPSLLKGGIFSKAVRSCSSCCLSSFHCRSNLPPYGSLQETSTRVKREISSHGDFQPWLQIGWICWRLIIENEPTPHPIPLLRVKCHPTEGAHYGCLGSASLWEPRRDVWWSEHWSSSPWLLMPRFSPGLVRSSLRLCWDGRFLQTNINLKWNFDKGVLRAVSSLASAGEYWMRHTYWKGSKDWNELLRATLGQRGLNQQPEVITLRTILFSFTPNVPSTRDKFHS